jgi:hypothetical protein
MLDMCSASKNRISVLLLQQRMLPPPLTEWRGAICSFMHRPLYFLSGNNRKQHSILQGRTAIIKIQCTTPHFKFLLRRLMREFGLSQLRSPILTTLEKTADGINTLFINASRSYTALAIRKKSGCPNFFETLYRFLYLPSLSLFYIFHIPLIKRIHSRYLPHLHHTNLQT